VFATSFALRLQLTSWQPRSCGEQGVHFVQLGPHRCDVGAEEFDLRFSGDRDLLVLDGHPLDDPRRERRGDHTDESDAADHQPDGRHTASDRDREVHLHVPAGTTVRIADHTRQGNTRQALRAAAAASAAISGIGQV